MNKIKMVIVVINNTVTALMNCYVLYIVQKDNHDSILDHTIHIIT